MSGTQSASHGQDAVGRTEGGRTSFEGTGVFIPLTARTVHTSTHVRRQPAASSTAVSVEPRAQSPRASRRPLESNPGVRSGVHAADGPSARVMPIRSPARTTSLDLPRAEAQCTPRGPSHRRRSLDSVARHHMTQHWRASQQNYPGTSCHSSPGLQQHCSYTGRGSVRPAAVAEVQISPRAGYCPAPMQASLVASTCPSSPTGLGVEARLGPAVAASAPLSLNFTPVPAFPAVTTGLGQVVAGAHMLTPASPCLPDPLQELRDVLQHLGPSAAAVLAAEASDFITASCPPAPEVTSTTSRSSCRRLSFLAAPPPSPVATAPEAVTPELLASLQALADLTGVDPAAAGVGQATSGVDGVYSCPLPRVPGPGVHGSPLALPTSGCFDQLLSSPTSAALCCEAVWTRENGDAASNSSSSSSSEMSCCSPYGAFQVWPHMLVLGWEQSSAGAEATIMTGYGGGGSYELWAAQPAARDGAAWAPVGCGSDLGPAQEVVASSYPGVC